MTFIYEGYLNQKCEKSKFSFLQTSKFQLRSQLGDKQCQNFAKLLKIRSDFDKMRLKLEYEHFFKFLGMLQRTTINVENNENTFNVRTAKEWNSLLKSLLPNY